MKRVLVALICLLTVGCSDPDSKVNADPNNVSNNVSNNGSNNGSNNASNNGGNLIDPSNYDQSCQFEDDCVLMRSGDPCGCGPCSDASINKADLPTLQSDIAAAMCGDVACPAVACGDEQLPHCNAGSCEVRIAKYVFASDWDQSCSVDEDCVAVFEGEVCDPCKTCTGAAINVADQPDYDAEFDVACTSNVDCACAPSEVRCNEGLCETL